MLTRLDAAAFAAHVDAHAVADRLDPPVLQLPVAAHADQLEGYGRALAAAILVAGWKIPVDAAADIAAFGNHGDLFGHFQLARGLHLDLAGELDDALLGNGRQRQQQEREQKLPHEQNPQSVFCGCSSPATCGADRASIPALKNVASSKPSGRATRTSGNC